VKAHERAEPIYLLHGLLCDILDDSHIPSLAHSECPRDSLFFHRRIPLGLDNVDAIGNSQGEPDSQLVSEAVVSMGRLPYPTAPVSMDMSRTGVLGSPRNFERISSRSEKLTRPSIRRHGIPLSVSILTSISRVDRQDVNTRLQLLRLILILALDKGSLLFRVVKRLLNVVSDSNKFR